MTRPAVLRALKRTVSLALLVGIAWLIATREGLGDLGARLRTLDAGPMGVAFLLPMVAVSASVTRWGRLLRAEGIALPADWLMRSFLRGRFVGAFTPSTTGLDVYRAVDVGRETGDRAAGGRVVVIEKLYGLISLALLTFALLPLGLHRFFGAAGLSAAAALGVASITLLAWMERRAGRPASGSWLSRKLAGLTTARRLGAMERARLVALGVLGHAATALVFAATGAALGVDASFTELAIVGNAIVLATLLPISVGGFGVREGTAVALLAVVGVPAAEAVLVALLGYLAAQPPALLGGVLQLVGPRGSSGGETIRMGGEEARHSAA